MKSILKNVLLACLCATASWTANATLIRNELTFQGGQQWAAAFTVEGDGAPVSITNFTVFFGVADVTNLMLLSSPAAWDTIVAQPDVALSSAGFMDALVLDPADALVAGQAATGFKVTFDWLGAAGGPMAFDFVVSDSNFAPLFTGTTTPAATEPQGVPEPGTAALALVALALAWRRTAPAKRTTACSRADKSTRS